MNRSEKKDENGYCAILFGECRQLELKRQLAAEKKGRRRKERKQKIIRPNLGFSNSCVSGKHPKIEKTECVLQSPFFFQFMP